MVIDIDGDALFNMTLMELSSAVQAGAPVKICVLNNEEQGMVTPVAVAFLRAQICPHTPGQPRLHQVG